MHADTGDFLLLLEPTTGHLVYVEVMQTLERKPKHYADVMWGLLAMNYEADDAHFAAVTDGDSKRLVLTSRLKPHQFNRDELTTMLENALGLSRRVDEVLGNAAPVPAPAPTPQPVPSASAAPGWYQDPQGQAQWRWYDGERWTEHTG